MGARMTIRDDILNLEARSDLPRAAKMRLVAAARTDAYIAAAAALLEIIGAEAERLAKTPAKPGEPTQPAKQPLPASGPFCRARHCPLSSGNGARGANLG